ncbi:MAG: hypothetical protein ACP5RC_01345, partial [Halothiobacillaceae bacterium]
LTQKLSQNAVCEQVTAARNIIVRDATSIEMGYGILLKGRGARCIVRFAAGLGAAFSLVARR